MPTNSPYILVVGGAGYIGSHMLLTLRQAGFIPLVLDNLSHGHRHAVGNALFVEGDMANQALLTQLFSQYTFAAVMHFASLIEVSESVILPAKYYQNNVVATLNLLEMMLRYGVKQIIFSSSAAVYGETTQHTISETHPMLPTNPYARSKWMVEEMIQDLAKSDALSFAILRYFNAAGAHPSGSLSEQHKRESHLIPLVLQVAQGRREEVMIFGNQYPTEDGTAIRDYIHVVDLCEAHLLALSALLNGKKRLICNLGTGLGYSVLQVIAKAQEITGREIKIKQTAARLGDVPRLVANVTYAKQELKWNPHYSDLATIILHAWQALPK